MMMLVITHTLKANGPCPDEQQAALLSGYRNNVFHQNFRQELSNVPCFRLADLWPLIMITLRSPAQYQGQQRSPWTRPTGRRVQNEPNGGRSRLLFRQSELFGVPQLTKKNKSGGMGKIPEGRLAKMDQIERCCCYC